MAGVSKIPKVLKPIDKVSLGEITSHRAVTTVNANVASQVQNPRAEPATRGRRQHGMPKSDRRGISTSAGWKATARWQGHIEWKVKPSRPGAKSPEQGRSYNRLNREVDRRREGGGRVRSSEEVG
jgi:hypothetical protein